MVKFIMDRLYDLVMEFDVEALAAIEDVDSFSLIGLFNAKFLWRQDKAAVLSEVR